MDMNTGFERMWSIISQDASFWTVAHADNNGNGILAETQGLEGLSMETLESKTGIFVSRYEVQDTVDTLIGERKFTRCDYYEVYTFTPPSWDGCSGGDDILIWSGYGSRNAFLAFYQAHLNEVIDQADSNNLDHLHDSCDYSF